MNGARRTALASIASIATVSAVVFAFLWIANTSFPGAWILVVVLAFTAVFGVIVMFPTYVVVRRFRHPIPWWLAIVAGFAVPLFVYMTWSGLGGYSGYSRLGQQVLQDSSGFTIWGWWNAVQQAVIFGVLGTLGTLVFGWIQGFGSSNCDT